MLFTTFFAMAPPFARVVSRFGATWFTMILGWGGLSLFVYYLLIFRGITRMALLYGSLILFYLESILHHSNLVSTEYCDSILYPLIVTVHSGKPDDLL